MIKKSNIEDYKMSNKAKIAKFIYKQNETSKQEICKLLGLSMPTVLQNIKELIDTGIVVEVGKYQSTGGRKAKALSISENIKYSIGVDITNNHISFVLLNLKGNMIKKERIRCRYEDSLDYYETLGRLVDNFIKESNVDIDKILGVGISIPGIVDEDNLILTRSHTLKLSNISLKNFIQFIKYDTCFKNDANSAAYAEITLNNKQCIYLSLSNTVGGAIYMNNSIYMGDNLKSAEFGHIIIRPDGKSCYCGKNGCVDAYCSANVLSQNSDYDLDLFFKELENGNEKYLSIWNEYLDNLAIVVTNLRMVFDCHIILGGYVGGYLENYILDINKSISKYNSFEIDTSYVSAAKYKKEASAVGAGIKFIDNFFDSLI